MKKSVLFYFLILFVILFLIFKNWFLSQFIIGGDWPYFYQEQIKAFSFLPPAWNSILGNGFGGPVLIYALDSYLYFTGWLFSNILHIPWTIVYKIFWFGMVLFLGTFSLYHLIKHILPRLPMPYIFLGIFIYLSNTYILLVVGGGQMGVALGYAIMPLVITQFIKVVDTAFSNEKVFHLALIAGLLYSVQVLFDFRMAYITVLIVAVYVLFVFIYHSVTKKIRTILSLFLSFINNSFSES